MQSAFLHCTILVLGNITQEEIGFAITMGLVFSPMVSVYSYDISLLNTMVLSFFPTLLMYSLNIKFVPTTPVCLQANRRRASPSLRIQRIRFAPKEKVCPYGAEIFTQPYCRQKCCASGDDKCLNTTCSRQRAC
jgi:hypothetical protein